MELWWESKEAASRFGRRPLRCALWARALDAPPGSFGLAVLIGDPAGRPVGASSRRRQHLLRGEDGVPAIHGTSPLISGGLVMTVCRWCKCGQAVWLFPCPPTGGAGDRETVSVCGRPAWLIRSVAPAAELTRMHPAQLGDYTCKGEALTAPRRRGDCLRRGLPGEPAFRGTSRPVVPHLFLAGFNGRRSRVSAQP